MKPRLKALSILLFAASSGVVCFGQVAGKTALETKASGAKQFYVDDQAGSNQISFSSQSTIEDFTGVCNKVRGECTVDPKDMESFKGKFSIRVADMRTGIDLRDSHLRSADWMDAEKYPEVVIDVTSIEDAKKNAANSATMTLVGTCAFHGKSNAIKIPAKFTYLDESPKTQQKVKGDLVVLRTEFKVKLSDYGVAGPKGAETIGLKVSDDIELKATVFGSTQPPPKGLEADKPVGKPAGTPAAGSQPAKPAPPKRP